MRMVCVHFQVNRRVTYNTRVAFTEQFNGLQWFMRCLFLKVERSIRWFIGHFIWVCLPRFHAAGLHTFRRLSGVCTNGIRRALSEATSLFFQGGAGETRLGIPNTVESAVQAGKPLAAAVKGIGTMKGINSISGYTSYSEINLESDKAPLPRWIDKNCFSQIDALRIIADLDKLNRANRWFNLSIPCYRYGKWKSAGDYTWGEPPVEYALTWKQIFGQEAFIFGYSNNVMAYIAPMGLNEGGYGDPFRGQSVFTSIQKRWSLKYSSSPNRQVNNSSQNLRDTGRLMLNQEE